MANKPQERLNFVKGVYGENWKKLRESKNKSVREFASIVNMSYSTISKIENEIDFPTIAQINFYQKLFRVSLDYLVGLTQTQDIEMSKITKLTGLSQEAIENITSFPFSEIYCSDLSIFLESENLTDYIITLETFISEYREMKKTLNVIEEELSNLEDEEDEYEIQSLRSQQKELTDRHDYLIWKMERSIRQFVQEQIDNEVSWI